MNIFANSILTKLKVSLLRVIVWDFDGTLWHNPKLGERIKGTYFDFTSKHSPQKISISHFDSTAQAEGSWGKAASRLTNLSEEVIVNWVEKNFNKTKFLKEDKKTVRLVEQLNNYRHFILTNSSKQQVEMGLKKIGFQKKLDFKLYPFEKIFGREELDTAKPNPKAFYKVQQYSREPTFRHLMIGDSYEEDIKPALKCGFQAIHADDIDKYLSSHLKF